MNFFIGFVVMLTGNLVTVGAAPVALPPNSHLLVGALMAFCGAIVTLSVIKMALM